MSITSFDMETSLFRVENPHTREGLWFCGNTGKETRLVDALNLTNKTLPMPVDAGISDLKLISAADSIENLRFWFSYEDLKKLEPRGFELIRFDVAKHFHNVTPWYSHPLFSMQDVIRQERLDISLLKQY